jgi:phosphate-selective porin OprO/OprP
MLFLVLLFSPVALAASSASETRGESGETKTSGHWHTYWEDGLHIDNPQKDLRSKFRAFVMADGGHIGAEDELEQAFPDLEGWHIVFRQVRLALDGRIKNDLEYKLSIEFTQPREIKDNWIEFKKIPLAGRIRAGNMKEPFSLQAVTGSGNITFMERGLPTLAFQPSRNIGIMVHNTALDSRMTWALGGFLNTESPTELGEGRDIIEAANGYNLTARITSLPWHEKNGRRLLHLGFSYQRQFRGDVVSDSQVQIRARPESHLTDDRLVDTGLFNAEGANVFNPELAIVSGPLSFQGEFYLSMMDATILGDPRFWDFYMYGSYFLTGEIRNYDISKGAFSQVEPKHNFLLREGGWGAWELALRLSHVDLNGGAVAGGKERNWTAGLNWYLTGKTRFMLNYVRARVKDRINPPAIKDSRADILQARFQIMF